MEACFEHQKGSAIDSAWRILDGSGDPRLRFGHECVTKTDMEMHGQARVIIASYSIMDGKLAKDFTHGKIARGKSGY